MDRFLNPLMSLPKYDLTLLIASDCLLPHCNSVIRSSPLHNAKMTRRKCLLLPSGESGESGSWRNCHSKLALTRFVERDHRDCMPGLREKNNQLFLGSVSRISDQDGPIVS
ncbi:hypothetical protein CEXT_765411 [Caerostris extrusa]|uniref:Uncharacterized protein n=1 Tax=Caerostris extrusa TaxID=172846 RepID=A0AAV4M470_CAEEX|nr:hypothetical protein CEXT_765411 [Caerostris extrusa]